MLAAVFSESSTDWLFCDSKKAPQQARGNSFFTRGRTPAGVLVKKELPRSDSLRSTASLLLLRLPQQPHGAPAGALSFKVF